MNLASLTMLKATFVLFFVIFVVNLTLQKAEVHSHLNSTLQILPKNFEVDSRGNHGEASLSYGLADSGTCGHASGTRARLTIKAEKAK